MEYKTNIHYNKVIASKDFAAIVEILPHDGHISYHHKARALLTPFFSALISYNTPILVYKDGELIQLSHAFVVERPFGLYGKLSEVVEISATTLRHIKSFCGINKKEYLALPYDYDEAQRWIRCIKYYFDEMGVKL